MQNQLEVIAEPVDIASMGPSERLMYHLLGTDQAIAELRANDERLRAALDQNHADIVGAEFRTQAVTRRARSAERARVRMAFETGQRLPRLTDGAGSGNAADADERTQRSLDVMGLLPGATRDRAASEAERSSARGPLRRITDAVASIFR